MSSAGEERLVGDDPPSSSSSGRRIDICQEEVSAMDWKLEVVVLPVSDVDRAKAFYVDRLGFHLDVDHAASESFRVVQVTPPGSACSVTFGIGMPLKAEPGTYAGLHLVVNDIEEAHRQLVASGVHVSE